MKFAEPLGEATLIRRYKRFLADVELTDGTQMTIHCPNTGSMKNCAEPGYGVWYSTSNNAKRKYLNTWELASTEAGHMIGINTGMANRLVEEAINAENIAGLSGYETLKREVKYGQENSRIDLLLTGPNRPDCYIEVKSVTLLVDGQGFFPDAVSTRGQKHLRELAEIARGGDRAVLFFCVQHTGIESVCVAAEIDPDYAAEMHRAQAAGVEVICYRCAISPEELSISEPIPFES
jgi:sugar fermentation stimulation protein A